MIMGLDVIVKYVPSWLVGVGTMTILAAVLEVATTITRLGVCGHSLEALLELQ